jgi:hypothetical protein
VGPPLTRHQTIGKKPGIIQGFFMARREPHGLEPVMENGNSATLPSAAPQSWRVGEAGHHDQWTTGVLNSEFCAGLGISRAHPHGLRIPRRGGHVPAGFQQSFTKAQHVDPIGLHDQMNDAIGEDLFERWLTTEPVHCCL